MKQHDITSKCPIDLHTKFINFRRLLERERFRLTSLTYNNIIDGGLDYGGVLTNLPMP